MSGPNYSAVAVEMVRKLRSSPALRDYYNVMMKAVADGVSIHINSAWMALGEREGIILNLLAGRGLPNGIEGWCEHHNYDATWMAQTITDFCMEALAAVPVIWPDAIRMAAAAGGLPPHIVDRGVMPLPVMWWTFENDIDIDSVDGSGRAMVAMLLVEGIDELTVFEIGDHRGGKRYVQGGIIPYGKRYPEDLPGAGHVLAMLSFMNSPYISVDTERPPRAERRSFEKHSAKAVPTVKVVRLRHPEHNGERERNEDAGIEYGHRWLVKGHHRAQWYPSRQAHKVIWIAPYIKGPADKPFVAPVYEVVR